MDLRELSFNIAKEAHKNQKRWNGDDYITHPISVAEKFMKNDFLYAVAILHDVIEDTYLTKEDLIKREIPAKVVEVVDVLSKKKDEEYGDFILKIKKNIYAKAVKISDIEHNLKDLKEGSMKDKYELALHLLRF